MTWVRAPLGEERLLLITFTKFLAPVPKLP